MKKYLFLLLSLMILTSCGTNQFVKDDISTLKSKIYHLESQNKSLTDKLDKLTQKVAIQENYFKIISQELDSVKSDLKKRIESPVTTPIQATTSSSTKRSSTKSTTPVKSNSSTVSRTTSTYSRRCQATTKKGTQCKRNAQSGRNYCWQH